MSWLSSSDSLDELDDSGSESEEGYLPDAMNQQHVEEPAEEEQAEIDLTRVRYPIITGREVIPQNAEEANVLFNYQSNRELRIIYENNTRIFPSCEKVPDVLGVKMEIIERLLAGEPFNANIFRLLFCIIQSGFVVNPPKKIYDYNDGRDYVKSPSGNRRVINSTVDDLKFVSSGAYGEIYRVPVNKVDFLFVLKTSLRDKEGRNSMIHEFFTGLILNRLRTTERNVPQTPNFMYVYALFTCFPISTETGKPVLCPATGDTDAYYLMTEHVREADLDQFLPGIQSKDLLSAYCQIILALYTAWMAFDYTHYDLHSQNVLVQRLETLNRDKSVLFQLIPYWINGEMIYIKTRLLPKIIDYGTSHITNPPLDATPEDNPEDFDHFGFLPAYFGILPTPLNSSIIDDLYRISGDIAATLRDQNPNVFQEFLPVFLNLPGMDESIRDSVISGEIGLEYAAATGLINFKFEGHMRLGIDFEVLRFIEYLRETSEHTFYDEDGKNKIIQNQIGKMMEAAVYNCNQGCTVNLLT